MTPPGLTELALESQQIQQQGYALLRQAIPPTWLAGLRQAFDEGVRPSAQWPVPRGPDWRHALVDLDPKVQALCRLPPLLAVVGALIGEDFFLAQVEGREPLGGGGYQRLHRDLSAQRPGDTVNAIAYLDDYGPANGATRLVPASHRGPFDAARADADFEAKAMQLEGKAGDILVFDADLVHAASVNRSGARRRSLLLGYFAKSLFGAHQQSAALRGVRMDTSEWFPAQG
ncbi:phytanoyl-CoA dioxygenase family protein [Gallaecimonas xiamenensis]|nr:phytanoyl-CoA dioxygenase family protein [Gallaecimonas xiamenensis]